MSPINDSPTAAAVTAPVPTGRDETGRGEAGRGATGRDEVGRDETGRGAAGRAGAASESAACEGTPTHDAVRIALVPGSAEHGGQTRRIGPLDGAWWPHTRDLSLELPSLVGALDLMWGRITRVAVNPEHWPEIPRKVPLAPGRVLHVGWFAAEQDANTLLVLSYATGRWDLMVIPPETPYASAVRLMAAAREPGNLRDASALLDREETGRATAVPAAVAA